HTPESIPERRTRRTAASSSGPRVRPAASFVLGRDPRGRTGGPPSRARSGSEGIGMDREHGVQQRPGVVVAGAGEDGGERTGLEDPARLHQHYVIGVRLDGGWGEGDEKEREAAVPEEG